MKNSRKFLWAMLPVAAAFALTACSSSDDAIEKDSQAETTIPYSITVGSSTTRATVGSNKSDLLLAEGDEIFIYGDNLKGHLTLTSGVGEVSGQFDGSITYKGEEPKDNASLYLVLQSKNQKGLTFDPNNRPTFILNNVNTFAETLQEAVQKFSYIYGQRAFKQKDASLMQNGTAFLDFSLTIVGMEATNDKQPVSVVNAAGETIAEGEVSVTSVFGQPAVAALAQFVVAVPVGTVMKDAVVTVGDFPYTFKSEQPLQNFVYPVEKVIGVY